MSNKPIIHIFENHLQYGERQFAFKPSITPEQFNKSMEKNHEDEYS